MAASVETISAKIKKSTLKRVFAVEELELIPYYDKHPHLGGTLRYLTRREFKIKFRCSYSESLWVTDEHMSLIPKEWQKEDMALIEQ